MEIHFGVNYTSNAFVNLKNHNGICLGHSVTGIEGLLDILELNLGISYEELSATDRQASYYGAFRKTMDEKDNVFSRSWEMNGLGVSNECLKWRDALRMSGWKAEMEQPSERLKVLAQVEKHFNIPGIGDRLERILPLIEHQNPLPTGSRIVVAAKDEKGLPPMINELLGKLQSAGTEIVYETDTIAAPEGSNLAQIQKMLISNEAEDCLKAEDDSFKIWNFNTELDAARYIASQPKDNYNVYVTEDSKLLDNVQRMLQQPTSGSSIKDSHPQITQLFKLGLSLFEYPFNIHNLVSWLQMPLHPIKSELRRSLAKVIISTGGYKNDEYEEAIGNYRNKLKEEANDAEHAETAIEKLNNSLETFIPTPNESGVEKTALLKFTNSLNTWCGKMFNLEDISQANSAQLSMVAGLCKSLISIVEDEPDNVLIPFRKLSNWINALYSGTNFTQYESQAGSRWMVAANDMADSTDRILWTDCYNGSVSNSNTAFLNENEKKNLENQGCKFWDKADFNRTMMRNMMRPVLKCNKQMVLVVAKTFQGESTAKHPLIIRLEKVFDKSLQHVCVWPDNSESEKINVENVNNHSDDIEVAIDNKGLLKMPETESYSSLDNLIQYPLDYVMERILKLRDRSSTDMDKISTVKGNVAHGVIEKLFEGNTEEIRSNIDNHFADILQTTTTGIGAILLLEENIIEWKLFKAQLKECVDALWSIIKDNGLTVVDREHRVSSRIGLAADNDPCVNGYVDMTLKNDRGEIFVFDFKWTSSKSWYKSLLEENIAIQLALYEELIAKEGKEVVASAYFTMPLHKLYTTSERIEKGTNVEHITPVNDEDLLLKIKNSYKFRREQILNGKIENAEGKELEQIPYATNQESKGLVPLSLDYHDKGIHSANAFSNYSCFKKD